MTKVVSISIPRELEQKLASKNLKESKEIIKFIRKVLDDVLEERVSLDKLREGLERDKVYLLLFWKGKLYKKLIEDKLVLKHVEEDYGDKSEFLGDLIHEVKTQLEKIIT